MTVARKEKLWGLAIKTALPVVLGLLGVGIGHEVRLRTIEGNRWTDSDERLHEAEENRLRMEMEERISSRFPPQWLKDSINEIKSRQNEIVGAVSVVREKLIRLEAQIKGPNGRGDHD